MTYNMWSPLDDMYGVPHYMTYMDMTYMEASI